MYICDQVLCNQSAPERTLRLLWRIDPLTRSLFASFLAFKSEGPIEDALLEKPVKAIALNLQIVNCAIAHARQVVGYSPNNSCSLSFCARPSW